MKGILTGSSSENRKIGATAESGECSCTSDFHVHFPQNDSLIQATANIPLFIPFLEQPDKSLYHPVYRRRPIPCKMYFGFLTFVKGVVGFFGLWTVWYWIADRNFKAKVKKLGAHPVMGKYFLPYGLDLVYNGMQVHTTLFLYYLHRNPMLMMHRRIATTRIWSSSGKLLIILEEQPL